jgi:type IV pilus assembly protein PilQ
VLIESRVVIANNDFAKDLGVRFGWSGSRDVNDHEINIAGGQPGHIDGTYLADKGPWLQDVAGNPFNSGIENPTGSLSEALIVDLPTVAPSGAINFLIGKIGSYLLQLELSAMQQEGRGEIISSPRVITADQNKATIKQGVEIPYQESSASGRTTVSFKEAVLQLEVTPHITPDDRVMMDLKVNKDSPDFTRQILGVPPVDTRAVKTSVLVDNGETVVLGGVYERTKSYQKEQVPLFGDLPVVGHLFKRTEEADENSELLIFVTPKILKETLSVR